MPSPKDPVDTDNVIRAFELRGGENRGLNRVMAGLLPDNKKPFPSASNALLILAHDPEVAGMLGFSEFIGAPVLLRAPPVAHDGEQPMPGPYPRLWNKIDEALILAYIQRIWCPKMIKGAVSDAMLAESAQRRFHPVKDWLATLKWDGKPRLDTWLHKVLGTPDDDYHASVGAKYLIAAVRRVRHPGCKFDQLMILEGEQELGKSTLVKNLFGEDWFSDSLHADLTHRDAPMSMTGKWGIELAEIEHLLRNGVEAIKAFLSRPIDTYRIFAGAQIVDVPRQSVMIGTTNTSDYLRDVTGNRRFWPVKCTKCESAWMLEIREQLWAEAAHREAQDEVIWLDDAVIRAVAKDAQISRMAEDSWTHKIVGWLPGRVEVRMGEVLNECLQLRTAEQTRANEMRAAGLLRNIGWQPKSTRKGSAVMRIWYPPPEAEAPF